MSVKTSLTKRLIKELGQAIEDSGSIQLARTHVKIPRSTFYYWRSLAEEIESENPDREGLDKHELLLLEFLDTIEFSRAKPGARLINAAWKQVDRGDSKIIMHMLRSLFPDEFNPKTGNSLAEEAKEESNANTGVALIPTLQTESGEIDLEAMTKAQQQGVQAMAKEKTARLERNED